MKLLPPDRKHPAMTGKLFFLFMGILLIVLPAGCSPGRAGNERAVAAIYNLGYADPGAEGINPKKLKKIDAIVKEAIRKKATPGAVVVVLKDGRIIFDRAYGHHTYDKEVRTRSSDIFDVASVTKIFATTLAAMRLVDQGKLDLDAAVGAYLPELNVSHPDKSAIKVRDLLTHRAGFIPFIPFFRSIGEDDYGTEPSALYPVQVADRFYLEGGVLRGSDVEADDGLAAEYGGRVRLQRYRHVRDEGDSGAHRGSAAGCLCR
jgi:CubicO group peptidase (beta-lactamase class C family)